MKIGEKHYRSIWVGEDGICVHIFDQTKFPHALEIMTLESMTDAAVAIREMKVRGAPLIGAVGAYGLALALRDDPSDRSLSSAFETLLNTRPTAVNLQYCLEAVYDAVKPVENRRVPRSLTSELKNYAMKTQSSVNRLESTVSKYLESLQRKRKQGSRCGF